jgi:hypothetical protein
LTERESHFAIKRSSPVDRATLMAVQVLRSF